MSRYKIIVRVAYRLRYEELLDVVSKVEGLSSRVEYDSYGMPSNLKELTAAALRSLGADWPVYARGQSWPFENDLDLSRGTVYIVAREYGDVAELQPLNARAMLLESDETRRLKDSLGIACEPDLTVEVFAPA